MNEKNCRQIIDFFEDSRTRFDKVPILMLALAGINGVFAWIACGVAMDGDDWMLYGAYFLLGFTVISTLCCIGYLISCLLKKTRIMFSLALCLLLVNLLLLFLYESVCYVINHYEWLGTLIIAMVLLVVLVVWYVWNIRCICKDIREGCYSDAGKGSPARIDNLIITISFFPLVPFLVSPIFRILGGEILEREVTAMVALYASFAVNLLLSKFTIKLIIYMILCIRQGLCLF